MKVGDMVREAYGHADDKYVGIIVEHRTGTRGRGVSLAHHDEIVILLTSGRRVYVDPKRWEVISESR
jgi:hypothetical protein